MLRVENLHKTYRLRETGADLRAVDGISFEVERGGILGIVGESGCGKSTTARLLVRLEEPTSGRIELDGRDITAARGSQLEQVHRTVQLVFQDPYASLNPRLRVGSALAEVLRVHGRTARGQPTRARVAELLEMVGLAGEFARRYPHELSGGQRQRVGIARALAVEPEVLVLDEPLSALDVSVQAGIVNLLGRLRAELGLTYVFISHDLGMVRHLSDRIAVMYLGRIVEQGPWRAVSDAPLHPYTQALQAAVPVADPEREQTQELDAVPGELPDPANPPAGCRFHTRCPLAEPGCRTLDPALERLAPAHDVACHVVSRERGGVAATPGSGGVE
ncbi:ABC transporter ATP-binding protein [Egibacter rhizosphaerae]|uniref:Glutathione import ATP-binding protein GsiA n=1 Tax=Egibacter rhizosphaerae TaxID=1670831 RepID=A0A411YD90_9ACTN|nr:ABC transporter ATP-binding protein [Egibacter rhizosphaerae]QBI19148.1 ABC transporter ATP-binding protein [Egibacter rhizosphaerae]